MQLELGTLQLSRTLCLGLGYKLAVLGPGYVPCFYPLTTLAPLSFHPTAPYRPVLGGSTALSGFRAAQPVFSFSRDFPGILIVLITETSGMGKWYSWDVDCLIFREPF